jgi:hypothetical protein
MNIGRWYDRYRWNAKLRRELRDHQRGITKISQGLISPTADWVPSVDTAHYSVRRYDSALSRWVYAPWDWAKAREVFACNMVKMSDGLSRDPFGDEHAATMDAANAPHGTYHFYRDNVNAITQAQVFRDKCAESGGYRAMVMIDCETITVSNSAYMSGLGSFYNELRKTFSGLVAVYSRSSFWDPIWIGAGSPTWTAELSQWQAVYPTALQTDDAKRSILYDGFIPTLPTYRMKGLGARIGWQWTATIPNSMIPGHNMVKAVEDGDLWRRTTIPVPAPPVLTYEQKTDRLWDAHPELHTQ